MSPEKHAIRDLQKQREGAAPEVVNQINRCIAAYTALGANSGSLAALGFASRSVVEETKALSDLQERTDEFARV
jgi:hypothetical protein